MSVHIVLWDDNHVVPRMARWLVERNGWTCSSEPRDDVAVNYYLPYLKFEPHSHPANTRSAAWFTHRETGTEWKMAQWSIAARHVDIPVITSPVYATDLPHARFVTPGVDVDLFYRREEIARGIGRVGTAGVGQPRKGPHLIVDLFYSDVAKQVQVVGLNWPFPHVTLEHDEQMPFFYSGIEVYLCTSLEEGVPEPVLEALACDTKVCIPHGVGICDMLPGVAGIRHYQKGNGRDMLRALKLALADQPAPGSLRRVVMDGYTKYEWCASHRRALENGRVSV